MDNDEIVHNQEGSLYIVGSRGYSAYEIAVQQGFVGTVDEWLDSLVGPAGPQGEQGEQGVPGPTGSTPSFRAGYVETLEPNQQVYVNIVGTPEYPTFNFGIPKGDKGDPGEIPDISDYVKNTDYAEWNKGGVVKTGNGFDVASNGIAQCGAVGYSTYQSKGNTFFISKGTMEAVFTGKGFLTQHQDLSNYIKNTDIARDNKAGILKTNENYGFALNSSNQLYAKYYSYSAYSGKDDNCVISKRTLENVITGKELTTKTYVDNLVGDINTLLDSINGESI